MGRPKYRYRRKQGAGRTNLPNPKSSNFYRVLSSLPFGRERMRTKPEIRNMNADRPSLSKVDREEIMEGKHKGRRLEELKKTLRKRTRERRERKKEQGKGN